MGCWNSTCGISNLPIEYGDPVVGVILVRRSNKVDLIGENNPIGDCYPDDTWTTISYPVEGIYNDYGSVIFNYSRTPHTITEIEYMFNSMLKDGTLVNKSEHKNVVLYIQDIFDMIERGNFGLKKSPTDPFENARPLSFMLVHKEIWETALENSSLSNEVLKERFEQLLEIFKLSNSKLSDSDYSASFKKAEAISKMLCYEHLDISFTNLLKKIFKGSFRQTTN